MSQEQIATLQAFIGVDADTALALLIASNNNVELAVARHFDGPGVVLPAEPQNAVQMPEPELPLDNDRFLVEPNLVVSDKLTGDIVPLVGVKVSARVNQMVADVSLGLRFCNPSASNPIEAIFKLADEDIIVHDFEVLMNGKIIKGECVEKKEAFARYDDGISSGRTAFLAEKRGKRSTFDISVGNMAPGASCIINVRYLMPLETVGDEFVFGLPVTRTIPVSQSNSINSSDNQELSAQVPDGLSMVIAVSQTQRIVDIRCASHKVQIEKTDLDATVTVNHEDLIQVGPKRFELFISVADPHQPTCVTEKVEETKGEADVPIEIDPISGAAKPVFKKYAMALSMIPKVQTDADMNTEVIFIVDCSGSMAGGRMRRAKNALQLFLRALPETTKFNIIAFGDRYTKLFDHPRQYNTESLELATQYVTGLDSKMGGTDLLGPISEVMRVPVEASRPRQIFLLTDGDVKDKDSILHFVREHIGDSTRVFCFGIGNEVSHALMRGIAKFGRGKAEFVESGTSLEAPVMRQVQRALQPVLSNISVDWGTHLKISSMRSVDYHFGPIFDGERLDFYCFFEAPFDPQFQQLVQNGRHEIKLVAYAGDTKFEFPCVVDLNNVNNDLSVQRFAAHQEIKDMEQSSNHAGFKARIIELASKYHLASKYTSFVAVAQEDERSATDNMISIDVDTAITESKTSKSFLKEAEEQVRSIGEKMNSLLQKSGHFISEQLDTLSGSVEGRRSSVSAVDKYYSSESDGEDILDIDDAELEAENTYGQDNKELSSPAPQLTTSWTDQFVGFGSTLASKVENMFSADEAPLERRAKAAPKMASLKKKESRAMPEEEISMRYEQEPAKVARNRQTSTHYPGPFPSSASMAMPAPPPPAGAGPVPLLSAAAPAPLFAAAPARPMSAESAIPLPKATQALDIIVKANANGSFNLDVGLAGLLGSTLSNLLEKIPSSLSSHQEIWATALAVAALEVRFAESKDEWQLVHSKAKKFLSKSLASIESQLQVDSLIETAKSVLSPF